jgi:hypothetical protein
MCKMGIERRCDAPHQEIRTIADRKPMIDHRHDAVSDEALGPRPVDDPGSQVAAVHRDTRDRSTARSHMIRSMMSVRKRSSLENAYPLAVGAGNAPAHATPAIISSGTEWDGSSAAHILASAAKHPRICAC